MLCFGITGLICCMFPALYSVAVFNSETLSAHYISVLSLHCRRMHVPKPFVHRSMTVLLFFFSYFQFPTFVFFCMEKVYYIPTPQCCDFWGSYIYLSLYIYLHSPPDLFYCPVALQRRPSNPVKSVCTGRTQGIKTADLPFFQIEFDPKPWSGFWAFVNLALKLKWSGQHIQFDGLHIKVALLTVLEENLWTLWKRD